MRFRQLILMEVNPRYQQMFAKALSDPDRGWAKKIMDRELSWAQKTLGKQSTNPRRTDIGRNDRIHWYMRIIRDLVMGVQRPDLKGLTLAYSGEPGTLDPIKSYNYMDPVLNVLHNKLQHYMSMPINSIQEFRFNKQPVDQVFSYFDKAEKEWADRQRRLIHDDSDNWTTLIEFPDGAVWFDLNTHACRDEARAMGHCGNTAAGYMGQKVLSLRFPKKTPDGLMWEPALTFILHPNGTLGERKGRGNTRPAPQYHKYIIELLSMPMIKGLKANTNYSPKDDFQMSDLPQDVQEKLYQINPNLLPMRVQFSKFGITNELIEKILGEFTDTDISYNTGFPKWDAENKSILVAQYSDLKSLVKENGDRAMEWAYDILYDGGFFDADYNVSSNEARELFDRLPDDVKIRIGEYTVNEYGEWYRDAYDYDLDSKDFGDVWETLDENDDDIIDAIRNGVREGLRMGAESSMYKTFTETLTDYRSDHGFYLLYKEGDPDEPIPIGIGIADAVEYLEDGAPDSEQWIDQITLDEPRYGWDGYDEDAALEYAMDQLPNEIVPPTVAPNPEQPSPVTT